jgi:hypothetical protein
LRICAIRNSLILFWRNNHLKTALGILADKKSQLHSAIIPRSSFSASELYDKVKPVPVARINV